MRLLSLWWESQLGLAKCGSCERSWPCHLTAWGLASHVSRCNVCGGEVRWEALSGDSSKPRTLAAQNGSSSGSGSLVRADDD